MHGKSDCYSLSTHLIRAERLVCENIEHVDSPRHKLRQVFVCADDSNFRRARLHRLIRVVDDGKREHIVTKSIEYWSSAT